MSKLSADWPSPSADRRIRMRLISMAVILVLVFAVMVAVRRGLLERTPTPPGDTEIGAPGDDGTTPLAAAISTDNGQVELDLSRQPRSADTAGGGSPVGEPPMPIKPDNITSVPSSAGGDNDIFASIIDGVEVRWAERDAYLHLAAMAWDLGRKGPPESPLRLKRLEIMAHPKQYRARPIRMSGRLLRVRKQMFDPDPTRPDRPRENYECAVKSAEEDVFIVLVYRNPLDNDIRPMHDAVWTDALFFKVWGYNDGKMKAPLLMGYELHKIEIRDTLAPASGLVLGGLILMVLILLLVLRRGRRQGESLRQRLTRENTEDIEIPEPRSLPRDKQHTGSPPEPPRP